MIDSHTKFFRASRAVLLLTVLAVVLTACGFKLRGAFNLPAELQKIYVVGGQGADLRDDLNEMLAFSAEVVSRTADADAILTINKEELDSRTLSVDSRGKVRESEIEYSVVYSLVMADGTVLLEKEGLLLTRDFIDDENDVIGRSNESDIIKRDLKRDAAQQILRRVQALNVNAILQEQR
ncbi:lipoprotein B transmembrane [Cycloclasticus sp. 46_120_T64]|nr:lipoprotein B transmembrane [Cycloclasticus sp. 46_120_T64]